MDRHGLPRPTLGRATIRTAAAALVLVSLGCAATAEAGDGRVRLDSTVLISSVSSEEASFRVETVAGGFTNGWGLAFLPDGGILVGEKAGALWLIRDGGVRAVSGLPAVEALGQGGLMEIAPHPDFSRNGLLFFAYTALNTDGPGTRIARARLSGNRLTEVRDIFTMRGGTTIGRHFGSRIVFPGDGTLLFTIGDRGRMELAQRLDVHAGKTLRIREDGEVPRDNPFVGTPGALPEIFTYGNRNAQGMAIQPGTGVVWQHEHGPRGGDEINIVRAGANYGWPLVTFGRDYGGGVISGETSRPGIDPPLIHWTPSIAPSGMFFYTRTAFPGWRGNLFVGALAGQQVRRLVVDGQRIVHQEVLLDRRVGRIRSIAEGPDGAVYLLTDGGSGSLLRLVPRS